MGNPIDMNLLKDAAKIGTDVAKIGTDAVKDWRGENTKRQSQAFGHRERVLEIRWSKAVQCVSAAKDAVKALADSYAVVYSARINGEKVRGEIAQKRDQEIHTHQREAEKLAQLADKLQVELSEKEKNGEASRESLRIFVDGLQAEYARYLGMEDKEFLSDEVTQRLSSLRDSIVTLTKEVLRPQP